ncbi:helicase HerA domain-containing protein [Clostridium tyrobutyricum]|uniref:helicase HerA domain-containing protein n=1 Tax=Clostridium tyrobutyricum TaxID=1519 RepID=UPI001C3806E4|nr:DUF87 domain-containing protein [Clostridium tyrobutyricum]MBV4428289.1 DUF87 domain-containing protein [Clostridium tyrobutyricum]MBV4443279.1 DUF87 domain-containing protein [Clostridium tyrobutyricum]
MASELTKVSDNNQDAIPQIKALNDGFSAAFKLVDDVVLKNYITKLPELSVVPLEENDIDNNLGKIRLFKITEMVYEQDESSTYKFASVFNAVAATNSAIITIIDSDGVKTDFYLGIRSLSDDNSTQTSYSTLVNAMKGQFPGTQIENLKNNVIEELLGSIDTDSLSAVSCVANNKNKDFIDNDEYLQGLEKLALAMQGRRYTAVILANSTSQEQLNKVRQGYESIYTQLSPYANTVVNYGTNSSESKNDTETFGDNRSESHGVNTMHTENSNHTDNVGEVKSVSQQTLGSKVGSTIGASLSVAGAVIGSIIPGPGTVAGAAIGSAVGGLVGSAISMATNKSVTTTAGGGSDSFGIADAEGTNETTTDGTSHSLATSLGLTTGETQNMQLTIQNKPLIGMLERIDKQLGRLSEFESIGMWECAAYFLSSDSSVSEVAAATYKALMSGENSGLEVSAINTWNKPQTLIPDGMSQNELIAKYVKNFIHPVFNYQINGYSIPVMPTSLVSGNELAIHMGLPRNSVCGFPVIEHADFGKEVVKYDKGTINESIRLGSIFNMGRAMEKSKVSLDVESLSMHTFIVGATGGGKSNTVYTILDELTSTRRDSLSFMVIEPAKGEYKRVFGHRRGVRVYGTNPAYTQLLRINPFKFPKNIHVLEHVDRLIEIFNVCWPMYAAMPAVLKDAVLASYESCGWDMTSSTNIISDMLFPTFQDLLEQLVRVINESEYSDEVKSNYVGSLTTRVKSLTNGLNGQIFSSDEIDNNILFDSNVIVDLSRIGSQETKSLLIGILVMRLSEHRISTSKTSNRKLHHITVLEEAHNILKASTSASTEDGGDIAKKSVEMISNAIAEMRTYGEGFIIADQSPNAVDISAIRNTNTKIIMRLPEESDRRISGKSAALKDAQLDEIARLPKGVAVVYQNDWIEPVLCQIDKFDGQEKEYCDSSAMTYPSANKKAMYVLINFVVKNRLDNSDSFTSVQLEDAIAKCDCRVSTKITLYSLVKEYNQTKTLSIWKQENFTRQAHLVQNILGLDNAIVYSRRVSGDLIEFNYYLNSIVSQRFETVTDDLLMSVNHCLLKAYSEENSDGLEYYQEWYKEITERGYLM